MQILAVKKECVEIVIAGENVVSGGTLTGNSKHSVQEGIKNRVRVIYFALEKLFSQSFHKSRIWVDRILFNLNC